MHAWLKTRGLFINGLMKSTVVFSVVYPGVEEFLPEFLSSLEKQSNQDFTLVLVNDGLPTLKDYLAGRRLDVDVISARGTATQVRKAGLKQLAISGVNQVIFMDADDYADVNRVEIAVKCLASSDIVVNELALVGEGVVHPQAVLKAYLGNGQRITAQDLLQGNCMGLTNTAARLKCLLPYVDAIGDQIIAFDWALFAQALHGGARAVFTDETKTYYRQYQRNIASLSDCSLPQVLRGVEVKRDHYRLCAGFAAEYKKLAADFDGLARRLREDKVLQDNYCRRTQQGVLRPDFWWRHIQLMEGQDD